MKMHYSSANKTKVFQRMFEGKVKCSWPSLRETRDKGPLGRDPDRSWCHPQTSVKLLWLQPIAPWVSAAAYERAH